MKLYKLTTDKWNGYYGNPQDDPTKRSSTIIAQTPNCDAFLLLSENTIDAVYELELLNTVPSGFDFTYCQEWGLETNQTKIDRVIAELS